MQLTVNNNKKPRLFEFCLFFLIIHRHFPSPPNFFCHSVFRHALVFSHIVGRRRRLSSATKGESLLKRSVVPTV